MTYQRSGTTWTQQIVRSILAKGDEDLRIDQAVPWLEAANSKTFPYDINFSTIKRPRAIKSHMPYKCMPCGQPKDTPGNYIYVARNPKDTAVSLYHFFMSFKATEGINWPIFASMFLSGHVTYGSYLQQV